MNRYVRNLQLEGFDETSQARLREASVAVVGAGALGSVVAMYLAAAGVGRLRIADFDTIDLTNLQRQVFFAESNVKIRAGYCVVREMVVTLQCKSEGHRS